MRLTVFQSLGLSWTICRSESIALSKRPAFSAASASRFSCSGFAFATLAPHPHEKSHAWVPWKDRRWMVEGPRRRRASRCSSLP